MKKLMSISIIVLLVILIISPMVFADEIDMNLPNNSLNNSITNDTNEVTSNINSNSNANTNTNPNTNSPVISNYEKTDFGLSNILNISLIVIGILLVLLSIAILIRLK